jgi:hypothetical protein
VTREPDRPDVLLETLRLAVPMHIEQLRDTDADQLCAIAQDAAVTIGAHGDALQFGGQHCAAAFNALARGLAAAALTAWGGVTYRGAHWCQTRRCRGRLTDHDLPVHAAIADPTPRHLADRPITNIALTGDLL